MAWGSVTVSAEESRSAAGLAVRVRREVNAPLLVVLGRPRTAVAGAVHVLLGLALLSVWWNEPAWYAAGLTAVLVGALGAVWRGVATVLRRPALAPDPLTLTIDERLRSEDAFLVLLSPLLLLRVAEQPRWAGPVHLTATLVPVVAVLAAVLWAVGRPPWRGPAAVTWSAPLLTDPAPARSAWRTSDEVAGLFREPVDREWEADQNLLDASPRDPWEPR